MTNGGTIGSGNAEWLVKRPALERHASARGAGFIAAWRGGEGWRASGIIRRSFDDFNHKLTGAGLIGVGLIRRPSGEERFD